MEDTEDGARRYYLLLIIPFLGIGHSVQECVEHIHITPFLAKGVERYSPLSTASMQVGLTHHLQV
jgi:hypothetical protein